MVKLPDGLRPDQIRILQEFRRLKRREMSRPEIRAIKHPVGGGEDALDGLVARHYLTKTDQDTYLLAEEGDRLLKIDFLPYYERG